jgi:hypothetical protein
MNRYIVGFLVMGLSLAVKGQYQFQHLNNFNYLKQESKLYHTDVYAHTSVRPLHKTEIDTLAPLTQANQPPLKYWLTRKMFQEDLVAVSGKDYAFTFNPVVNLQLGQEQGVDGYRYINQRGFLIEGRLGKSFTFYSSYLENQARFANYVNDYTSLRGSVPGQGSATRPFGDGGFDFGLAAAEISYNPSKFFTFTAGQGRNFFGEGYRSMLLSDGAYNYPFFRIETTFWRVKYVNLWAQLTDIRPEARVPGYNAVYARKFLSSHYLSINVNSRLNLNFFEAIVTGDTLQQRGLDPSFFNPVIFYRPVEFQVGSGKGNALIGFGGSYKITNNLQSYGQFILDEFSLDAIRASSGSWVNKFGWQLGLKSYNTFGLEGLFTRLEYNAARPYTYSHRQVLTNYGHFGSPLAHPWGANFSEIVVQAIYQHKRWEFEWQLNYGTLGLDSAGQGNFGSDIYRTYNSRVQNEGNEIGQGVAGTLLYTHLRAAWVVNPKTNLKLELGVRIRNLTANAEIETRPFILGESVWPFFGLRTELFNSYYDF